MPVAEDLYKKIKGVIYDLDGTIISTQNLHENAWLSTANKFGIKLTRRKLLDQRGISDKAFASAVFTGDKKKLIDDFVNAKREYVSENIDQISVFPDGMKALDELTKRNFRVWISTSSGKNFVKKILDIFPELKKYGIVWREMYLGEKPSPEILDLTVKKMGLKKSEVIYVGDALNDYETSVNGGVKFVYFCPKENSKDSRIPQNIPVISNHEEIMIYLEDINKDGN